MFLWALRAKFTANCKHGGKPMYCVFLNCWGWISKVPLPRFPWPRVYARLSRPGTGHYWPWLDKTRLVGINSKLPSHPHPIPEGTHGRWDVSFVNLRAAYGFLGCVHITVQAASGWALVWSIQNRHPLLALAMASQLVRFPHVSCAQLIPQRQLKINKQNSKTTQKRETITELATGLNKKLGNISVGGSQSLTKHDFCGRTWGWVGSLHIMWFQSEWFHPLTWM